MQDAPGLVAPYCGQTQVQQINVPAPITYRQPPYNIEEGPWQMIPYSYLYPQPPEPTTQYLPPPIGKTDLWRAQGTFPL
jgi:hypothetical protein